MHCAYNVCRVRSVYTAFTVCAVCIVYSVYGVRSVYRMCSVYSVKDGLQKCETVVRRCQIVQDEPVLPFHTQGQRFFPVFATKCGQKKENAWQSRLGSLITPNVIQIRDFSVPFAVFAAFGIVSQIF